MTKDIYDFIKKSSNDFGSEIDGPGYRCAVTLNDGTNLPCVIIRHKKYRTDLALKRFEDEKSDRSFFLKKSSEHKKGPYRSIVEHFVTKGNRINDYDIQSVDVSRYAIPIDLLNRIQGETFMGWTGWVFEMTDGSLFSYGSTFNFAFFNLPSDYNFSDVSKVYNHSFINDSGDIESYRKIASLDLQAHHAARTKFRERVFFECYIDDI